ncbi:hypothetical protein Tco_1305330 [Tanacetum coccineum]
MGVLQRLYEECRKMYGVVGTFKSVYYKYKKARKTEKEVHEAEQAQVDFERQWPRAVEDVIAPHGAGISSTNNKLKDEKNSSKLGHAFEKIVRRSSSIAAKKMSKSKNYNSYYPITLPLRCLCFVKPCTRFLMHKSLGEEKEYVETKMNTALKIAL